MSDVELRTFKKHEYKKIILSEISASLPDFQKKQYDQTAQCVVNFLQSEVKSHLRKISIETPVVTSNLLSETVLQELDSVMQPANDESDSEMDIEEQSDTDETVQNEDNSHINHIENPNLLNDSITKLKEAANKESVSPKQTVKDKLEQHSQAKNAKCSDTCKVKITAKKKYDMIQCTFCMGWYHETCVGIKKDDPIGIWVCLTCRNVPSDLKNDITCLKREVEEIKQNTLSVVKAIEGLSTKLENSFGNLNDRLTSVSRQINSKDLCISESIEILQSTTNNIKTSVDQKSNQILNKTTAVFEKVKSHTENLKTFTNNPTNRQNINKNKGAEQPKETDVKSNKPNSNINATRTQNIRKPAYKPRLSRGSTNSESQQKRLHNSKHTEISNEEDDPIDLTERRYINQSTILVGSSILKGIKTTDLKFNTTVRSFPGATTESLRHKLRAYNLDKCKTVILHVGGNDADNGKDVDEFSDNYISLLNCLAQEDRRIIVSGILPRHGTNLEPYNDQLKSLCEENDIEFINNFDSFLFASGELPKTYFANDKLHLNYNGTRKLLSNIDNIFKVTKSSFNGQTAPSRRNYLSSGYRAGPQLGRGLRSGPHSASKFCHICLKRGHNTQECWFNGRIAGVPERSAGRKSHGV